MRIAVIGAGVVGVAAALALARRGHEPVVFDRRATIGEEASFGCTGLVTQGWPWPWPLGADPMPAWGSRAAPGWLGWVRRTTAGADTAALAAWVRHARALIQLGEDLLDPPQAHLATGDADSEDTPPSSDGLLVFWRHADDHDRVRERLDQLADAGLTLEGLDIDTVRSLEPGLDPDTPLARVLRIGQSFTAVPRQAAMRWRNEALAAGARFEMAHEVLGMTPGERPRLRWRAPDDEAPHEAAFDAVAVCAGAASAGLLRAAGWRGQSWLLQGKSVSAPLMDAVFAPRHPVFDADRQTLLVTQGGRLRIAGAFAAARASAPASPREAYADLYRASEDWFPGAARLRGQHQGTVQHWEALISRSRDGLPLIGVCGLPGIWVNMDHGAQGWAMAPGSARLLTALIERAPTPIEAEPFSPGR